MALNPLVRTYTMPDADLLQRSDAALGTIDRDAADFATRGVDATRIRTFKDARDSFSDFPTDEELAGALTTAAETKDAARHTLEMGIRTIRNMAEIKYKGNGHYKTFGFDDMTHLPDNDLFRMGRRVERIATTLQADLATEGFTHTHIRQLHSDTTVFDEAIDAVAAAIETRDIQTQQRVQYGNDLFAMLSDLASIGKSLYEDTDEARYNDYVIYDSATPPTPPAVPPGA